ncbi:hypothetical protein BC831DRAFT_459284 [Entophlyctis helioformis]|nr:hypothetical protein BC831DRAFT_459284 [Entophlyctis helioformis]
MSASTMPLGQLLDAIHFAAFKHRAQTRMDAAKTPYINHPIGVAHILFHEGGVDDAATLMGAILHDTVEDTDTSLAEIEERFGPEVCRIVKECTDDKTLPKMERKRLQIETAPHKSHKAKLVKLADKIYNMRDMQINPPVDWTRERCIEYFAWGQKVTDGCKGTNAKLEGIVDGIYAQGPFGNADKH